METITTPQLHALCEQDLDLLLVDVLPERAHEQQHVAGSICVPLAGQGFADRVRAAAGSRSRPIVVYCQDARCNASTRAAQALEAAGFVDVMNYEAGLEGWKRAGHPLVRTCWR